MNINGQFSDHETAFLCVRWLTYITMSYTTQLKLVVVIINCYIDIAGDSQNIKEMLKSCNSKVMLSEVCYVKDEVPHFPCFDISSEVFLMLQSLKVMNSDYRTDIFSMMWTKMKDEIVRQNRMLSLAEVYHFLWKPIHIDCEGLIDGLNSLKIKLHVVQSTFGGMDPDKVTEQVKMLVKALSACRAFQNDIPLNEPSEESLRKIVLYNQLCDFQQAIAALNQLREKLGLSTTDLSSSQVSFNSL